jgi:hypothetical protein
VVVVVVMLVVEVGWLWWESEGRETTESERWPLRRFLSIPNDDGEELVEDSIEDCCVGLLVNREREDVDEVVGYCRFDDDDRGIRAPMEAGMKTAPPSSVPNAVAREFRAMAPHGRLHCGSRVLEMLPDDELMRLGEEWSQDWQRCRGPSCSGDEGRVDASCWAFSIEGNVLRRGSFMGAGIVCCCSLADPDRFGACKAMNFSQS